MALRNVASYPFVLAGGTAATVQELPPFDLSRAKSVRLELDLTGKGSADAGDTLDFYLQEAADDLTPTWDDRAHLPQFTGAMTVSAAAPVKRVMQWDTYGENIGLTDANYTPSGSADGARLAAGAFIGGPLLGKRRTALGQQARHRFRFEVTDANANSAFAGTVNLYVESEV